MRGFKRDRYDTDVRYRLGIFKDKEKRSFLSLPKESDHGLVQHELLKGIDRSERRNEIYKRDKGMCWYCGFEAVDGDMCHREHAAGKKCDCTDNLRWGHHDCHMKFDHDKARLPRLRSIPNVPDNSKGGAE